MSWEDLIMYEIGGDDCKNCSHLEECRKGVRSTCMEETEVYNRNLKED